MAWAPSGMYNTKELKYKNLYSISSDCSMLFGHVVFQIVLGNNILTLKWSCIFFFFWSKKHLILRTFWELNGNWVLASKSIPLMSIRVLCNITLHTHTSTEPQNQTILRAQLCIKFPKSNSNGKGNKIHFIHLYFYFFFRFFLFLEKVWEPHFGFAPMCFLFPSLPIRYFPVL